MSRHRESAPVHAVGEGPRSPIADRAVVLVVDDDAAVRDALHLTLDREYAVMDAPHGRAALSMVRSERVDLILLDILMPEIDGLEILQELKALEPDLPVIMMTAVKTVRTTVAAMKLGASDYLTKPSQEEELPATSSRRPGQRTRPSRAPADRQRGRGERQGRRAPRPVRLGGDRGWRATPAVALAPASSVATTATLRARASATA